MPIRIDKKLPAVEILQTENIFVMDDQRAAHQDIRPLKILIKKIFDIKKLFRYFEKNTTHFFFLFFFLVNSPYKNDSLRAYGDLL